MGYPMTWRRVVGRNGLVDGDYTTPPIRHIGGVPTDPTRGTTVGVDETWLSRAPYLAQRVEQYEKSYKMLAGDIRRLENDALDEQSLCKLIASRANVDADTVAAVLQEFFNT